MDARGLMGYRFEKINADKTQYRYERHQTATGLNLSFKLRASVS